VLQKSLQWYIKMNLKNIIKTIFPDEETKKMKIEESLEITTNQIIEETKLENPGEYFLNRLSKQYKRLTKDAKKYGMDIMKYEMRLGKI